MARKRVEGTTRTISYYNKSKGEWVTKTYEYSNEKKLKYAKAAALKKQSDLKLTTKTGKISKIALKNNALSKLKEEYGHQFDEYIHGVLNKAAKNHLSLRMSQVRAMVEGNKIALFLANMGLTPELLANRVNELDSSYSLTTSYILNQGNWTWGRDLYGTLTLPDGKKVTFEFYYLTHSFEVMFE